MVASFRVEPFSAVTCFTFFCFGFWGFRPLQWQDVGVCQMSGFKGHGMFSTLSPITNVCRVLGVKGRRVRIQAPFGFQSYDGGNGYISFVVAGCFISFVLLVGTCFYSKSSLTANRSALKHQSIPLYFVTLHTTDQQTTTTDTHARFATEQSNALSQEVVVLKALAGRKKTYKHGWTITDQMVARAPPKERYFPQIGLLSRY